MASCKCGGKTIRVNKAKPKKVAPKVPKSQTPTKAKSERSMRLSKIATKKAVKAAKSANNPFAKGCKCS